MRFHHDWCTRGKLIFTNLLIKGIWHRKFKGRKVNYDNIILIIITIIKMSQQRSSEKKCEQPSEALAPALQKIERKQNKPLNGLLDGMSRVSDWRDWRRLSDFWRLGLRDFFVPTVLLSTFIPFFLPSSPLSLIALFLSCCFHAQVFPCASDSMRKCFHAQCGTCSF